MIVGSWLSGEVGAHYATHGTDGAVTRNWQMIWAIPAVLSVVLTVLLVVLFMDREPSATAPASGKSSHQPIEADKNATAHHLAGNSTCIRRFSVRQMSPSINWPST